MRDLSTGHGAPVCTKQLNFNPFRTRVAPRQQSPPELPVAFPDQSSGATRSICTHMTRIHLPLPAVSPTSPSVNNAIHTKSTPVHSGVRGSGKYRSLRTNNGRMSRNEGYHVIQRQKLPLRRSYRSRLNHFPFSGLTTL